MLAHLLLVVALGQTASSSYLRKSGDKMTGSLRLDAAVIAADDATPSIAGANFFVTSANTGATAITDLDNALVGQWVVICGGSAVNSSTIADAGNFSLESAFTAAVDKCILLLVQADNDYVELARTNPAGWVGTATSNLAMGAFDITFGTDPADQGDIRHENGALICWEASPAGVDRCITLGSDEVFSTGGSDLSVGSLVAAGTVTAAGATLSGDLAMGANDITGTGQGYIRYARVSLTEANIVGSDAGDLAHADGVTIVAGVANHILWPLGMHCDYDHVTATYTGGGANNSIRWASAEAQWSAALSTGASFGSTTDRLFFLGGTSGGAATSTGEIVGKSLMLWTSAAYTQPGSAAGTAECLIAYTILEEP